VYLLFIKTGKIIENLSILHLFYLFTPLRCVGLCSMSNFSLWFSGSHN